ILNERMIWASQEARPYSFSFLAAAASFHALLVALEEEKISWWICYVLWTLLGLTLHGTFLFAFIAQLIVVGIWLIRRRRMRWDWMFSTGLLALLGGASY